MKRLIAALAALAMLSGEGLAPTPAVAAENCCWLYCETYRDACFWTLRDDREYCEAWYEGCIDGCQYPGGPTSEGGGFGGGGGGTF